MHTVTNNRHLKLTTLAFPVAVKHLDSACDVNASSFRFAATDASNSMRYECWARSQMRYILGSNGLGRSFVVGFGKGSPVQPHHRGSSCQDRPAACGWNDYNSGSANPQVLFGALVGGEYITLQ